MTQTKSPTVTSSQPDTPANPSVSPGTAKAKRMTATSGRTSAGLLHSKDPLGSFSKTFMATLAWVSTRCLLTWKPKATPAGRLFYQLQVSMPRTDETDSGLWPTPLAQEAKHAAPTEWEMTTDQKSVKNSLRIRVAKAGPPMWPTPTAALSQSGGSDATGKRRPENLASAVKTTSTQTMWPTPRSRDWKDSGDVANWKESNITDETLRRAVGRQDKTPGALNPTWVEWLMGYPEGWTDLKA